MRLILCVALAAQAAVLRLPPGADLASAKDFGAVGDGKHDDTEAIQRAVHRLIGSYRYLYFPAGTYRITRPIEWKFADRDTTLPCRRECWSNGLAFLGEDRDRTVFQLRDSLPAFGDKTRPLGAIITASGPNGVESRGDNAFGNSILNLTVDVGRGNPGAVGIDYLANNVGAIREVTVRAGGPAHCGIMMNRPFIGPCLIKDVAVSGFDYAIKSDHNRTHVTLEDVTVTGQALAGLRIAGSTAAIRNLLSRNGVVALESRKPTGWEHDRTGLVTLVDSRLLGGTAPVAFSDGSYAFLRNVATGGYHRAYAGPGGSRDSGKVDELASVPPQSLWPGTGGSLALPVEATPSQWETDPARWSVLPPPSTPAANLAAFKAALARGRPAILFRPGAYVFDTTVTVTGAVRHVLGNGTTLKPGTGFGDPDRPRPLLELRHSSASLTLQNLNFSSHADSNPGLVCLSHASARRLVLKDLMLWDRAMHATYRPAPGAGDVHLENVSGQVSSTWAFGKGQGVWARQFNVEGPATKITVRGARLWILGIKTESTGTVIKALDGARVEILGGLFVNWRDYAGPAFSLVDSDLSASFSTSVDRPSCHFRFHSEETRGLETRVLPLERLSRNPHFSSTAAPLYVSRRPGTASVPPGR